MRLAAAVLAAGGSTRLGRPKQLVAFEGAPLVVRALALAHASEPDAVAVVRGAYAREVDAALDGAARLTGGRARAAVRLANDVWQEGMASSIRAAVRWARVEGADGLAVILVDQPAVPEAHLRALAHAWRAGAVAAASAYGGVVGAPAVIGAALFDALEALRGDRGAAGVLRGLRDVAVLACESAALDVDTEADVTRLAPLTGACRA